MELDIPPACECSQEGAGMVEPYLWVTNAGIWHCLSSRTRSVAGMVPGYEPAFPQLAWQVPAGGGGTSIRTVLGSSGKEGEGADNK